ncbi:MAG TPA: tRNA pseudouridine(38-40) synthase TruA [Chthoniobacterales bacterium]|nr:tRNA pseudouridine(38-40) synthase TruA [Chthoniobacterales bacterium]
MISERLKLTIAYDGASFSGWQSQANGNTIQDSMEGAFRQICGHPIRVHGSGRTDAGVHALAQTAHADVPLRGWPPQRWLAALNGSLPPKVRVTRCATVAKTFHARFAAKGKVYRYRIWNARVLPPFEHGRAWHVAAPLSVTDIVGHANTFLGTHDFAEFAANRGQPIVDTVRTIRAAKVRCTGDCITIEFDGDGFLYKMVRLMVGAVIRTALGKEPVAQLWARLKLQGTESSRFVAPAEGLYLVRVRY